MDNPLKTKKPTLIVTGLILIFVILILWQRIFITIKPGQAGVLWLRFSNGTVLDKVYDEGTRIIFPWDEMTLYTVRQQTKTKDVHVLTKHGLKVKIVYSVRYKPEYDLLAILHTQIGPDYLERVVIPEVEASLRHTAGGFTSEDLYSNQHTIINTLINNALNAVAHRFIKVDNVNIREIVLPKDIQDAIDAKLVQAEKLKTYVYILDKEHKEAERRKIEADGLKRANEIIIPTLSDNLLRFKGIKATEELSKSPNSKVVIIGSGKDGLPIILGGDK